MPQSQLQKRHSDELLLNEWSHFQQFQDHQKESCKKLYECKPITYEANEQPFEGIIKSCLIWYLFKCERGKRNPCRYPVRQISRKDAFVMLWLNSYKPRTSKKKRNWFSYLRLPLNQYKQNSNNKTMVSQILQRANDRSVSNCYKRKKISWDECPKEDHQIHHMIRPVTVKRTNDWPIKTSQE